MHFVTGGAFNGKSNWVKDFYQLEDTPHLWLSAYRGAELPAGIGEWEKKDVVVLEGIELWLKSMSGRSLDVREQWQTFLQAWKSWERGAEGRMLILIGSDITKGIVPIDAEERKWRDAAGWAFQDTAAAADQVDLVWYGIRQKLK